MMLGTSSDKEIIRQFPTLIDVAAKGTINEMLTEDGSFIQYMKNPTPEQQMVAVQGDIHNVKYIKKPSMDVCRYVLLKDMSCMDMVNITLDEKNKLYIDVSTNLLKCVKGLSTFKLFKTIYYSLKGKSNKKHSEG